MGPGTFASLQQLLQILAADPAGLLIAATDADIAGRRYAVRLQEMATEAVVPSLRLPDLSNVDTAVLSQVAQRESDPGVPLTVKGYDSDAVRQNLPDRYTQPEIPTRQNRKVRRSVVAGTH
jgi:hypothetical protein